MPTIDEIVADAMGVAPELAPLMPELFEGFTGLGGAVEEIVEVLREHAGLRAGSRVVDLGCGKGAVAVAVARELGVRVLGVDLYEPFLADAREAAADAGVDRLVSFRRGDLRDFVRGKESFDAAIFAAVGAETFGSYADCTGEIRRCVRPGGHLLIADGFFAPDRPGGPIFPGYGYYREHDEAVRQLVAHGDALVHETLITPERARQQTDEDLRLFRAAVDRILEKTPERRAELDAFLLTQQREIEFLLTETTEAVWLLERSPTG